jgi:ketosteroid isomerase-like protein
VTSSVETAILAANRDFYRAFAEQNADAMAEVWAREHVVACIHPGRGALHGRDVVMASWRAILASPEAPEVTFTDAILVVVGDAAFVTCIERIGSAKIAATNVFVIEGGKWRLVHHHAGPMASIGESRRPADSSLN